MKANIMYLQDEAVKNLLNKQQSSFLKYCDFNDIPLDADAYFFSFNPAEET